MEIQGGKFLTFLLGEEEYAIPIKKVKEILGRVEVTQLEGAVGSVIGAGNFRSKNIPIVDLRRKFGSEDEVTSSEYTCVIIEVIIAEKQTFIGVTVDIVSEVASIAIKDIEPPPEYEARIEGDFLAGLGKFKNKLLLILDCDKILGQEEMDFINQEFAS